MRLGSARWARVRGTITAVAVVVATGCSFRVGPQTSGRIDLAPPGAEALDLVFALTKELGDARLLHDERRGLGLERAILLAERLVEASVAQRHPDLVREEGEELDLGFLEEPRPQSMIEVHRAEHVSVAADRQAEHRANVHCVHGALPRKANVTGGVGAE